MNKKDYLDLISTYIRVILGFIGITSSFLIPILMGLYFRYFVLSNESESLTLEQLNNANQNIAFLVYSLFIFLFSLLSSLILFARFSFSDRELKEKSTRIILQVIMGLIIVGVILLIISFWFFLLFFVPNDLFLLNAIIFSVIVIICVLLIVLLISL